MAAGFFLTALLAACFAAIRWGTKLDRLSAVALIAASFLSIAGDAMVPGTFAKPELGVAAVDVALLVFLLLVMRASNKFWPIWAVGFHSISVVTHLVVLAAPSLLSTPYAIYSEWWGLPVVLAVMAGCLEKPATSITAANQSWRVAARR